MPGTTPRILVCDDDEGIRGMLVAVLEAEGFEVACVGDGPACLAAIAADTPDILVLDGMMPGMDGYQVMEAVRRDHQDADLKVVMLTARTADEDIWTGWSTGVDYYMAKPFDPDELLRFLHFLARSASVSPVD